MKTSREPLVSIITPIYNGAKYIDTFIQNYEDLTYNNTELILVNDASTDNSLAVCKKYEIDDARICVVNLEKNGGAGIARNAAIDIARGKYIFFFDCDDTFESEIIEKCIIIAGENNFDTVLYNVKNVRADGSLNDFQMNYPKTEYYGDQTLELAAKSIGITIEELYEFLAGKRRAKEGKERNGPWRMMYSRCVFDEHNLRFPNSIRVGEDTILTNEYLCYANAVGIINETLYYCHENPESTINTYDGDWRRMIPEKVRIIREKIKMSNRVENWGGIRYMINGAESISYHLFRSA